jgi:hypothetical protein
LSCRKERDITATTTITTAECTWKKNVADAELLQYIARGLFSDNHQK